MEYFLRPPRPPSPLPDLVLPSALEAPAAAAAAAAASSRSTNQNTRK